MRAVVAILLLAVLCVGVSAQTDGGVSSAVKTSIGGGLEKPIIEDPMASPHVQSGLEKLSQILAKEPDVAREIDADDSDKEEDADSDEELLKDDDCDKAAAAGECGATKKDGAGKTEKPAEGAKGGDAVTSEISDLEKMIKHAMDLSKQIPEKVKRLEELKSKQQSMNEESARAEASSTLENHRKLLSELAEHISALEKKLNELKSKKSELESSDKSLKKELEAGGDKKASFLELPSNYF